MTCGLRPASRLTCREGDSKMEITTRGLWTLIRGMGFGGLYLLSDCRALAPLLASALAAQGQ